MTNGSRFPPDRATVTGNGINSYDRKEAWHILGLPPGTGINEIKKRYRKLILQAHPDSRDSAKTSCPDGTSGQETFARSAQELNLAWAILKKRKTAQCGRAASPSGSQTARPKEPALWDAPVNENAYTEREILHYAEDSDGTISGSFCIARGKYLWKTQEDFPLFQLSIYRCSKSLLDEAEAASGRQASPALRQAFQAELAYLLARQFMDGIALLKELAEETPAGPEKGRVFYLPSMLEPASPSVAVMAGETLYPSAVRQHRLYIRNQAGQEPGYLSFPDDRLYYIVVPLFEQRKVQVRIQDAGPWRRTGRQDSNRHRKLHVWIRLPEDAGNTPPEDLNPRIRRLLERFV